MIEIAVPGAESMLLYHLVLDFNGTLAFDGGLLPGVDEPLHALAAHLALHVVTADTFGRAHEALSGIPCRLTVLPSEGQELAKLRYVEGLGPKHCAAVGNGLNDRLMLMAARLGIAVVQGEGAAVETLLAAKIAMPDIHAALGLLLHPARLRATLRT